MTLIVETIYSVNGHCQGFTIIHHQHFILVILWSRYLRMVWIYLCIF